MFAVVNYLHFTKPADEFRQSLEEEGAPILSSQPGFRNFYFVKTAEDRAIVIILWETATDAQAGAAVFGPTWFAQNVAPYLASEQQRSVGEVIVGR